MADTSPAEATAGPVVDAARADQLRWFGGSALIGLFATALFDQFALPSVADGVAATRRFHDTPWARVSRTAAAEQIMFWGDDTDRRAEMDRLRDLHRAVRGTGDGGRRYSALHPETWNWILMSIFLMQRNAYTPITGDTLSPADDQYLWELYLDRTEHLQLPGRSRLPGSYVQMRADYADAARGRTQANPTLDAAVATARRPPAPDGLPRIAQPLWALAAPLPGHALLVLGFGILDPQIRDLTTVGWNRAYQLEFHLLAGLVQVAHRWLPQRLTTMPLARNRREYERTIASYRARGLATFTADAEPRAGLG